MTITATYIRAALVRVRKHCAYDADAAEFIRRGFRRRICAGYYDALLPAGEVPGFLRIVDETCREWLESKGENE